MAAGIKDKILGESYSLFLERGYSQTTLRAIAEACGITHANVLYHFKGKEDIARQIIGRYLNTLKTEADWIAARHAVRTSPAFASLFWVTHLCYMTEYPEFARFFVDALWQQRELLADIILQIQEEQGTTPMSALFNVKERESHKLLAWKTGVLSDADYRSIEMLLSGMITLREAACYMLALLSLLFTGKKPPRTTLERDVSLMLDLIEPENLKRIHAGCSF
ncbi:MAG: TetR/AcrR family transcriptional regulator [Oscillospiraceae bacterium]|nr:TetR/AcrR family transcriptional regulator [Oscillospiraceae bacterium]